jgi:hypothetical protein
VTNQANDEVIPGATVILSRWIGGGGGSLTPVDTVATNAAGEYTLADVAALNNYVIDVEATGFFPDRQGGIDLAGEPANSTVTENFQLDPVITMTISGTVTNQANDEPIAGATVVLGERDGPIDGGTYIPITSTTTNAAGEYTFSDVPTVDNYYVEVSADGFLPDIDPNVDLAGRPAGSTETIDFALDAITVGNLYVFVLADADNAPVPDAGVVAALEGGTGEIYTGTTNAQGLAAFEGALTGDYTITVTKSGWITETQGRQLTENENDTAYVLLAQGTSGRTLSGTISNSADEPIGGAEVVLQAYDGGAVLTMMATTLADGAYSIEGIPFGFGNASLTVSAPGFLERTVPVDLQGGTPTANVTLQDDPSGIGQSSKAYGTFDFRFNEKTLHLNLPNPTRAALYDLQGRVIFNRTFTPGSHAVSLQLTPGSVVILLMEDGTRKISQKSFIP